MVGSQCGAVHSTTVPTGSGAPLLLGRSYRDAPEIDGMVLLPGEHPVGAFVTARITAGREYDLVGEVIESPAS